MLFWFFTSYTSDSSPATLLILHQLCSSDSSPATLIWFFTSHALLILHQLHFWFLTSYTSDSSPAMLFWFFTSYTHLILHQPRCSDSSPATLFWFLTSYTSDSSPATLFWFITSYTFLILHQLRSSDSSPATLFWFFTSYALLIHHQLHFSDSSPATLFWFITSYTFLILHQLRCSDSSPATLFWFFHSLSSLCALTLPWAEIFFLCCTVYNSLPCKVWSSNTHIFQIILKPHLFNLFRLSYWLCACVCAHTCFAKGVLFNWLCVPIWRNSIVKEHIIIIIHIVWWE